MKKLTFLVIAVLLLCLCTAPALASKEAAYKKAEECEAAAVTEDAVEQFLQRYAAEMGSLSESGEIVVTDELRYNIEQLLVLYDDDLEKVATLLGLQ